MIGKLFALVRQLRKSGRLSRWIWVFLATVSLAIISQPSLSPSLAQSARITEATIAEIVGQQVLINRRLVGRNEKAKLGERIQTTGARVELKLNTGAIARLGSNSALVLGSQCFQLQQGQVLVNGGSSGCTSSVQSNVRDATYLLERLEENKTHYAVLEGEIELSNPKLPNLAEVSVQEGQEIIIEADGRFNPVQPLSHTTYEEILLGELMREFSTPLPNLVEIKQTFETLYPDQLFPPYLAQLIVDKSFRCPSNFVATYSPVQTQQDWTTQLRLSRLTSARQGGLLIQLNVVNKPLTRYANAVYQIYALQENRWVPLYTNTGARLINNQNGSLPPMSETIPLEALRLQALGDNVNVENLELKAVVKIRYDLSMDERDLSLEIEETQAYPDIPISNCLPNN
ncbi:hypothetical protein PN466_10180 [Roseofilum reptotaenium CS-1145]|uniref:FecR protein domain-containing protein n=1 Tax=Roseofilum reptotaenium AO1-A TaxID=1925591 RepID=A0A1L9QUF7_9CYAN|nr:hypothetical protein [Roseofilum reptotaenium]MDB9517313.1 hypothetical protein [Roseofilum reptotaenium CS-1145]OJJ26256.1 hypothetical protein BI308_07615 [Roseofilum reptotaenium AO1-A]